MKEQQTEYDDPEDRDNLQPSRAILSRVKQQQVAAELVSRYPNHTAGELAVYGVLTERQLSRRLGEAATAKAIERGPSRICEQTGHRTTAEAGTDEGRPISNRLLGDLVQAAFTAGWDAGFQEALKPDIYPEQDRCAVAYDHWCDDTIRSAPSRPPNAALTGGPETER